MNFLLSSPGGFEWLLILIAALAIIACPVLAIVYYTRNKELRRQLEKVTRERNDLLA